MAALSLSAALLALLLRLRIRPRLESSLMAMLGRRRVEGVEATELLTVSVGELRSKLGAELWKSGRFMIWLALRWRLGLRVDALAKVAD